MNKSINKNPVKPDSNFWVNYGWLVIIIATLVGLYLRNTQRGFETYDMVYDFTPWYEHLKANGGFAGIATVQSDYPVSYLYILALLSYLPASAIAKIKVVTAIFEIFTGIVIYFYVKKLYPKPEKSYLPILAYLCFYFLPSVILNGAVWGQVDIIYSFFLIICLYFLLKEKFTLAFIAYAIAFAFKLQAIFFLPFLGMHFLKARKYSFLQFLWIPLVLIITALPAIFLGRPPKEVFSVYLGQIGSYPRMVFNFGNIYNFFPDNYELFALPAVVFTLFLLLTGLLSILRSRKLQLNAGNLPDFALLSILVCVCFLPGIHERYMFAAVVIAVPYLFTHPRQFYIPLLIWLIEPNAYLIVLWGIRPPIDYRISALILMLVIALIIINITKPKPGWMGNSQIDMGFS